MEQSSVSMRRLLNRRMATRILQGFASLLPDAALGLVEPDGKVYVQVGSQPTGEGEWDRRIFPLHAGHEQVGTLTAWGAGLDEPRTQAGLQFLHDSLIEMLKHGQENRALAQETLERYREINLLYNIGETISASLDPDEIPRLVLVEAARIIRADCGLVLLTGDGDKLCVGSGFGDARFLSELESQSASFLGCRLEDTRPLILSGDDQTGTASIGAVLCAPLKTRERVLGFVLLGRLPGQAIFTAGDQKLLSALAGQAAVDVENARLFTDVRRQRDAIAEMKNYMDNIFASIASGVITTDVEGLITILNRAAERILGVDASHMMGQSYLEALPAVGPQIADLVEAVKQHGRSVVAYEVRPVLPQRGPTVLQIHISPLKDNHEQRTGIAIVVDDLTDRWRLEEQVRQVRGTFERYVPTRVVEQLLSDPSRVQLGGVRQEVTVLFADIRGFTPFSARMAPEALVRILNRHLTLAADAVLAEDGTLDKFMGDAVMAIFNAPLSQPDHTLRAVRAALRAQQEIARMHAEIAPDEQLSFGVAIVTGTAVVGNVGSPVLQNYTAVGDCVNLAWRLQGQAAAGQVLLNDTAYERVRDSVTAEKLSSFSLRGYNSPVQVYDLLAMRS